MAQVAVQKLYKKEITEIHLAVRYFTILAAVGNIHLTQKQIELLAFTAVKGTISSGGAQQDFVEHFKSSKSSLANLKHYLVKRGFIVKLDNKYQIAPNLALDFTRSVVLQVNLELNNGQSKDRKDKNI